MHQPILSISGVGIEDGDISWVLTADLETVRGAIEGLAEDEAYGAIGIVRKVATLLACGTVPDGMTHDEATKRGTALLKIVGI